MNNTANALLAAGASPIMAHAHPEMNDMVSIVGALVINIGTPRRILCEEHAPGHQQSERAGQTLGARPGKVPALLLTQ